MAKNNKPVADEGALPGPRPTPFHAGGDQGELAGRKTALMNTGRIGYVPGHEGTGRGSSAHAGHIHEQPPRRGESGGFGELVRDDADRRPMPRRVPVSDTPTHTGVIRRYLDGHSEIHRERPGLVEQLRDPETPDHARQSIRDEITMRDSLHNHRYW